MIDSGSITRRLAYESGDIFRELAAHFEGRKKLEFSLNLLSGLLEEDLPYYYLPDLPNHSQLLKQQNALKQQALIFLQQHSGVLFVLLLDEKIDKQIKENLFYLLAKYLPEVELSFREYLRFGMIILEFAQQKLAGDLPVQALCRYDLEPLAKHFGIDIHCSQKPPYPQLTKRLKEPKDDYARLYLLLTREARILHLQEHGRLPPYDSVLAELAESLIHSLPLSNPEAVRTALEQCARRPDPLSQSGERSSRSQSISKSQTITQTITQMINEKDSP